MVVITPHNVITGLSCQGITPFPGGMPETLYIYLGA
nr:MAG TPA: hypothetical protein [Inoviridae sp.]